MGGRPALYRGPGVLLGLGIDSSPPGVCVRRGPRGNRSARRGAVGRASSAPLLVRVWEGAAPCPTGQAHLRLLQPHVCVCRGVGAGAAGMPSTALGKASSRLPFCLLVCSGPWGAPRPRRPGTGGCRRGPAALRSKHLSVARSSRLPRAPPPGTRCPPVPALLAPGATCSATRGRETFFGGRGCP